LASESSVDAPVRAEKSELFPDWGRPTMHIFTFVFLQGIGRMGKRRMDYSLIRPAVQEALTSDRVLI
jgi:hypothetical protein